MKFKRRNSKRGRASLLAASSGTAAPLTIPAFWLKNVIGVFLLPICAVFSQAFFRLFSQATIQQVFWATGEFWFFSLGVAMWLMAFFAWPKPMTVPVRVYVYGHELTHALWVVLMGGRVMAFKVHRHGGHIITDTTNFWIALTPYFFPFYSLAVVALYGILAVFFDVYAYRFWLFGFLGATWAFHFSFTCWMIPKGQTDLTDHGTFFSLVVIYLMNLLLLLALFVVASPEITWVMTGHELIRSAADCSAWLVRAFDWAIGAATRR